MKKNQKILIGCGFLVIIIVVICMIYIRTRKDLEEEVIVDVDLTTSDEMVNPQIEEDTGGSEKDILNDLDSLFAGENGYETIEGDFGFIGDAM